MAQRVLCRANQHYGGHMTQHNHPVSYGRQVQADLREPALALRAQIPQVYEAFKGLSAAAFADGALDRKTKELIALALSVATQCDGCMASHARGAARHGASPAEVAEALGICIQMMGGPGTVYAPRAFAAYQEFAQGQPNPASSEASPS